MLFVGMLAFQLAGALLLLLNCVKGSKKAVIRNCFPGSNVVKRDENNNCKIPKEKMRESAHKIYLNIVAFGDLVVGYAMAMFSPVAEYTTGYTVLVAAIVTVVLLVAEYYMCRLVSKLIYSKDELVPYDELEQNGVDTVITRAEIDAMCNGTHESED
jgi:hypothetical protein